MIRLGSLAAVLLLLLVSACSTAPESIPSVPTERARPTLAAPVWAAASEPITLANVPQIQYLGRLDAPNAQTTVFASAISPDGTRLVGLNNSELLGWDLLTGALIFRTARLQTNEIYYSPEKIEFYALSAADAPSRAVIINALDAETGAARANFTGIEAYSNASAFHADEGWLALGGLDGSIKVWDSFERVSRVTIAAHSGEVTALAFNGDGTRLASAGIDGRVRVWDWAARTAVGEVRIADDLVRRIAFDPSGELIALGLVGGARLWRFPDQTTPLPIGMGGATDVLAFDPTGSVLIGGNRTAGVYVWNPTDGTLRARLPGVVGESLSAAFSLDGRLLVTAAFGSAPAMWDLTQMTNQTLNRAELNIGSTLIARVDWSPDGRLLLFYDAAGSVYAWGIASQLPT